MTVVSPRNPNLCLSCDQLIEDDSAELEKLLSVAEHSDHADPFPPALVADEFSNPSSEQALEHPSFVAPA